MARREPKQGGKRMNLLYLAWALLMLVFVVIFFAMEAKENKATKKLESAIDPMFRPTRNGRSRTGSVKPGSGARKAA
jgi:hypothetical protein